MGTADNSYYNWQKKLAEKTLFRRFWKFWAFYSILLIFAVALYLLAFGFYKIVFVAFCSFVLARLVFSPLVYAFYKKARPYQKLNFEVFSSRLFSKITSRQNSFPSDHAVSFASISAVFCWFFPVLGIVLIPATVLNGYARVVLGYHYISDVLAGWVLGLLAAFITIHWLLPLVFTR